MPHRFHKGCYFLFLKNTKYLIDVWTVIKSFILSYPSRFLQIASCSDDNTVRIWRLNRRPDGENSSNRDPNLVGWTLRKIQSPPRAHGKSLFEFFYFVCVQHFISDSELLVKRLDVFEKCFSSRFKTPFVWLKNNCFNILNLISSCDGVMLNFHYHYSGLQCRKSF